MRLKPVRKSSDMEVIRDLKVKKSGGREVHAVFLRDNNGYVFYQEDGGLVEPYREVCHTHDCSACKHWVFNASTVNDVYHQKPLPAHTSKCELVNGLYKGFDITFHCQPNGNRRPVCKFFEQGESLIIDRANVNQFIDWLNSCNHSSSASIQGISYKGRQAPFSFNVKCEDWENLSFIDGLRVTMYQPICWEVYNFEGKEYRGWKKYCELYGITDRYVKKEIEAAFSVSWIDTTYHFNGRTFDFESMWFTH